MRILILSTNRPIRYETDVYRVRVNRGTYSFNSIISLNLIFVGIAYQRKYFAELYSDVSIYKRITLVIQSVLLAKKLSSHCSIVGEKHFLFPSLNIRLSEKRLSFATMRLCTNMKPDPSNVVIFIFVMVI